MSRRVPWLPVLVGLLACSPPVDAPAERGLSTEGGVAATAPDGPKTARQLVAEANAVVTTVAPAEAMEWLGADDVVFVDLREADERTRLGWIPGAVHVPRGMLEFYIDSDRPERRAVFHSGRRVIFYCAAGGRSALAARTAAIMGLDDVAHVGGGFRAWVEAGGPVASPAAAGP